jgi:hypothetical protein
VRPRGKAEWPLNTAQPAFRRSEAIADEVGQPGLTARKNLCLPEQAPPRGSGPLVAPNCLVRHYALPMFCARRRLRSRATTGIRRYFVLAMTVSRAMTSTLVCFISRMGDTSSFV